MVEIDFVEFFCAMCGGLMVAALLYIGYVAAHYLGGSAMSVSKRVRVKKKARRFQPHEVPCAHCGTAAGILHYYEGRWRMVCPRCSFRGWPVRWRWLAELLFALGLGGYRR